MTLEQSNKQIFNSKGLFIGIAAVAGSLLLFKLLSQTLVNISMGEVGVIENIPKNSNNLLYPGIHLVNPLNKVIITSTRVKNLSGNIDVLSKEGINYKIGFNLGYHIDPQKADKVYQKVGSDDSNIILPLISASIDQIASNYGITAIYGNHRNFINDALSKSLANDLKPLGFVVDKFSLQNVVLPNSVVMSLQDKFIAQQNAEKRMIEAKAIVDGQKLLHGAFSGEKTVVNVVSDDSTFHSNSPIHKAR
jgi:regulator of protease activity HflC (stomatin/prohibitin superfamily)